MDRRERFAADREGRKPRKLNAGDYLLGVYDETRMGAIRFKADPDGVFLSDDKETAAPPWATLRTLEEASRNFENEETTLQEKWLNQLIKPGSSLGGARPKATVQAAIGSVPMAMGLSCGKIVLSVAVLAILITAPLGALGIDAGYKKLLMKENKEPVETNPKTV